MTCSKIYFKLSVNAASCGRQERFAMHGLEDQYFLIWVSKMVQQDESAGSEVDPLL